MGGQLAVKVGLIVRDQQHIGAGRGTTSSSSLPTVKSHAPAGAFPVGEKPHEPLAASGGSAHCSPWRGILWGRIDFSWLSKTINMCDICLGLSPTECDRKQGLSVPRG